MENGHSMIIEDLFNQFLHDKIDKNDNDIEYCLMQSTVEPTIRFKFGSWLNEHFKDRSHLLTINLMETNRIDLVVGIEDQIFIIEFGHLLNILKHKVDLNYRKIEWDTKNIANKAEKILSKIKSVDRNFDINKRINYIICSLFSDFKVEERENRIHTLISLGRLNAGTLFKYGNNYKNESYFKEYRKYLNQNQITNSDYLFGYKEIEVVPSKLSLHFKFDYPKCNIEL